MSTPPVLDARAIGRAHYALRAVLERELHGTGLSFERWTALNAVGAGEPDPIRFLSDGLRQSPERVRELFAELTGAGLLTPADSGPIAFTPAGRQLWERLSARIRPVSASLFGDLDEADRARAARMLTVVTERAQKLLV